MESSIDIPNEVGDKPPPSGCKLENSKERNLMQREEHSSKFWTLLQHDEALMKRHEIISDHMSFQHIYLPLHIMEVSVQKIQRLTCMLRMSFVWWFHATRKMVIFVSY